MLRFCCVIFVYNVHHIATVIKFIKKNDYYIFGQLLGFYLKGGGGALAPCVPSGSATADKLLNTLDTDIKYTLIKHYSILYIPLYH